MKQMMMPSEITTTLLITVMKGNMPSSTPAPVRLPSGYVKFVLVVKDDI